MSFAFSARWPKQWSQFLILGTQPDTQGKNTGRLFRKWKHKQSNSVGFISPQWFPEAAPIPQLKILAFCLHWGRSLLESTAGFHTGFYRSAALVQGRADWKHQEAKNKYLESFKKWNILHLLLIHHESFLPMSETRQWAYFRALHSSAAAPTVQRSQELERFGSAAGTLKERKKLLPTDNHQ